MERKAITTPNAPAAIGPYNQGIVASGQFLFGAGQIALEPATGKIVGDTLQEQTHQVLKNVRAVLHAAGADLKNVVKTTVFLHDLNDFAAMNEIYAQYFEQNPPARSAVGGLDLPKGAKIEIEYVAVI